MIRRHLVAVASATVTIVAVATGACGALADRPPGRVVGIAGDPDRGRELIVDFGCGACHRIPGVAGARGLVGPPLDAWSRRGFIAGSLPNDPANLQRWLVDPQGIRPGSAMPDLGLDEVEAGHVAAYLFGLR